MEGINKLFNEIIKGASEELKSKSSSELVTLLKAPILMLIEMNLDSLILSLMLFLLP